MKPKLTVILDDEISYVLKVRTCEGTPIGQLRGSLKKVSLQDALHIRSWHLKIEDQYYWIEDPLLVDLIAACASTTDARLSIYEAPASEKSNAKPLTINATTLYEGISNTRTF